MDLLIYTIVGLSSTWLLYIGYMYIATRSSEGKPVDCLYPLFPQLRDIQGRALLYCYSPHCGPCRPMSKEIDQLIEQGVPVFKLDIAEHPALSRELGIRATPTLVVIEDGTVQRMLLGVRTADHMLGLINPPPKAD